MKIFFLIMIGLGSLVYADFSRIDGVVLDNNQGLEWQDSYLDNNTVKFIGWEGAIEYCENLVLNDKSDWRLPNVKELSSLIDDSRHSPAIYPVFENTVFEPYIGYYWSSTTSYLDGEYSKWMVSFFYEGNRYVAFDRFRICAVRCVRGGD